MLPPARATLCHDEARNDVSPRFFRKKMPLVIKHSRQNSTLAFTLHPSPFWCNLLWIRMLWGWRVLLTLHHPSPTLHPWKILLLCEKTGKIRRWRVGEGWWRVCVTLHPPKLLSDRGLCMKGEGWRVYLRLRFYPFLPKSAGISPHFFVSHFMIGTVTGWVRSQFSARAMTW